MFNIELIFYIINKFLVIYLMYDIYYPLISININTYQFKYKIINYIQYN